MQFVLTRTPFRISFFGGSSDYPHWYAENKGAVLSTAIDKYVYLSCRYLPPFFGVRHRIVWRHVELVDSITEILHPAVRQGLEYLDFDDSRGVEIHYQADLPARTGMGSSSSFVVGLINGMSALRGQNLSKRELADKAIDLEQRWMGDTVGSQDQIAAAYGGFNHIEFEKGDYKVNPISITSQRRNDFLSNLMLFYIGSNRLGTHIANSVVKSIRTGNKSVERMVNLVDQAVNILQSDAPLEDLGHMLHETWELKRSLSSKISTTLIDEIYEIACSSGALGGKLLGAGGTGFMLFYVPENKQNDIREVLKHRCMEVPFTFDETGGTIIHHSVAKKAK